MNYVDIFLLVFLIIAAIKGYSRGFVVETFAIIAFFIGLFLAIKFTAPVAVHFFSGSPYFEIISVGVFIAIFIGLSLVINLLAKVVKKIVDLSMLGMFDNILGSLIGMLKFALIASILIWMFNSVGFDLPDSMAESSILPFIKPIGPVAFELMGSILPFFKDIFESVDEFGQKGKITDKISVCNCYFT